jgi:hypothetical protein
MMCVGFVLIFQVVSPRKYMSPSTWYEVFLQGSNFYFMLPLCLIKRANLNKVTAVHAGDITNRLNNNCHRCQLGNENILEANMILA